MRQLGANRPAQHELPKHGAEERVVIRGGARAMLLHGGLRAPTRQTHMVQYRDVLLRALPTAVAAAAVRSWPAATALVATDIAQRNHWHATASTCGF